MDIIKNCLVTNTDAKVLREYCIDKLNPLYQKYRGFNTSINLEASNVFNIYSGYVAVVFGNSRSGYEIVVSINYNQAIKYGNLKSVDVTLNQSVDIGQKLGEANKYVSIEYLSTYVKNQYSFRLRDVQMYKDDPSKIINVATSDFSPTNLQYNQSGLMDFVDEYNGGIDPMVQFILSDNT